MNLFNHIEDRDIAVRKGIIGDETFIEPDPGKVCEEETHVPAGPLAHEMMNDVKTDKSGKDEVHQSQHRKSR